MEISKKDLLKETGISYGQLYRWKREGLIPEEWFMRRSAFTGQETFFPKDKILPRIHAILEMKEQYSLEEMAEIFQKGETTVESMSSESSSTESAPLVDMTDLPEKMRLVLKELCPDGYEQDRRLLLSGLAALISSLPVTLTDTKALVSAALSLPTEELTTMTLGLWASDRPHYFLTLHTSGTRLSLDSRCKHIGSIPLHTVLSTLQNPSYIVSK